MERERLRMRVYRGVHRNLLEPWILPYFFSSSRLESERGHRLANAKLPPVGLGRARIWFHAASVGEMEGLWSVVIGWLTRGGEAIVTIFSESAEGHLQRLRSEAEALGRPLIFAGFSPWEGRWGTALERAQPLAFVTAKYEAWPELWAALAHRGIPLVVVGAIARRSLKVARTACRVLTGALPRIKFLPTDQTLVQDLLREFPEAEVSVCGDPRWDRLFERARRPSARAKGLVEALSCLARPWGVLGQVWPEDLEVWGNCLGSVEGTLWVVPHDVNPDSVRKIESQLRCAGLLPFRTSEVLVGNGLDEARSTARACALVDEMGFLAELYAFADWAFVGGGFGRGLHSTMEPAAHGLPVCAGPKNAEFFPETALLRDLGQLSIIRRRGDIESWLERLPSSIGKEQRELRRSQAEARRGAVGRVVGQLEEVCSRS